MTPIIVFVNGPVLAENVIMSGVLDKIIIVIMIITEKRA